LQHISKTDSGTPKYETHAAIIYGVNDGDQNIPEVLLWQHTCSISHRSSLSTHFLDQKTCI